MALVGGLRIRSIRQGLYDVINDGLDGLGWFDSGRKHLPVTFTAVSINRDEEIPLNTIALADGGVSNTGAELGSNLAIHRLTFYVDVYAQSDALGLEISTDIRDILQGRFSSTLGLTGPEFPVYDYRMATPPLEFYCTVTDVETEKAQFWSKPWQQHYFGLLVTVEDEYADEDYQ